MTRFTFVTSSGRRIVYDVPSGIDIVVDTDVEACSVCGPGPLVDFDFVKDGDVVPMLGGTDEHGARVPSWADLGIKRIPDAD